MNNDPLLSCPWEPAKWLLFSENVPTLLYYSHIIAIISALLIGTFIFVHAKKKLTTKLLSTLFVLFSCWAVIDIAVWASNSPSIVLFWWSIIVLIEPIIYVIGFYTVFAFIYNRFPNFRINLLIFLLLLPLFLLTPTDLNLSAINIFDCDATEGPLAYFYTYVLEFMFISAICVITTLQYKKLSNNIREQKKVLYFSLGMIAFLAAFTSGNVIGSITENWNLAQYGLFGMPIFVGFLAYLIVEFKLYNITIIASQVLVVSLWILIGSLLLVAQSTQTKVIASFTLVTSVILGLILIRSTKRTIKQREEIEKLAVNLENANERLKELDKMKSEFVSIASHQLRSPLTSIRGYTSMLTEGSYGPLPQKAKEAVDRIAESSRLMALSIEDYLNVSRIQSGNMKYELSDFNVKNMASKLVDDKRREAMKKGLLLTFKNDLQNSKGITHADVGKTTQIIHNLIDNSMKYTPKGRIEVTVTEDVKKKQIAINISDTGIGMAQDAMAGLFEKFKRADIANSVNVTGTGLGLYIARKMAQDMGGDITVSSPGAGLGSTFTISLPLHL